jgi:hypothetical protein
MTDNAASLKSVFATAKQSLVLRPNSINVSAFIYHSFADLKNLIKFVGTKPQIDEEGRLYFKKVLIPDNCVILRDTQGKVQRVMTFDEAESNYEIVAQSDFKPEHANTIIPVVVKSRSKK